MTGIEPALSAWEADVLPLNYIRRSRHSSPGEHQRWPRLHIVQEQMAGSGALSAPDIRAETNHHAANSADAPRRVIQPPR
jgi:hypothetical protein